MFSVTLLQCIMKNIMRNSHRSAERCSELAYESALRDIQKYRLLVSPFISQNVTRHKTSEFAFITWNIIMEVSRVKTTQVMASDEIRVHRVSTEINYNTWKHQSNLLKIQ